MKLAKKSEQLKVVDGTMIYISSFIKIGSGIQKLIREVYRHTDRMEFA
jgi:hypothetical protein